MWQKDVSYVSRKALEHLLAISDSKDAARASDKLFFGLLGGRVLYLAAGDASSALKLSLLPGPQLACDIYYADAVEASQQLESLTGDIIELSANIADGRCYLILSGRRLKCLYSDINLLNVFSFVDVGEHVRVLSQEFSTSLFSASDCIQFCGEGAFLIGVERDEFGYITRIDESARTMILDTQFSSEAFIDARLLHRICGNVVHSIYAAEIYAKEKPVRFRALCDWHAAEVVVMPYLHNR